MGSLGALTWSQVSILGLLILVGVLPIAGSIKSYNALLMGETYARSMGIHTTSLRWWMIGSAGILAGGITAFCGPIAFLGIAVLILHAWRGKVQTIGCYSPVRPSWEQVWSCYAMPLATFLVGPARYPSMR